MPRHALMLCLALLAAAVALRPAALPPAAAEDAPPADSPALWELMEQMGEHLRDAKQALNKPDGLPEAADLASQMQALAVRCKAMTPPKLAAMPEGEQRDELQLAYRTAMIALIHQLLDLESAALADDKDKAFAMIDQLVETRFKGHLKFKSH